MEGVPVTLEHVRRILAGDPAVPAGPESKQLVLGYEQAMNYVLRRADDPGFEWNRELIIGLHDRILAGRHDFGAGRIRAGQNLVVDALNAQTLFVPPPPEGLSELVDQLCLQVREPESHPAVASAWVHVGLAAVHPFKDGNGRVARVLSSLTMYRGGFRRMEFTSLEQWWGRHKASYYEAFSCLGDKFNPKADVTSFIQAHVQAQLSQVRALDLRERVERRIWTAIEDLAEASGLSRRVANALWDAFFGRQVAAGYYRALAEVSPATATSDLALASVAKLLKATGRARGRSYSAGENLQKAVAKAVGLEANLEGPDLRTAIIDTLTSRETAGKAPTPSTRSRAV